MRNNRTIIIIFSLLFAQTLFSAQGEVFKVVRREARELIIDFVPQQYQATPVKIKDKTYIRYQSLTSGSTLEEGKPDLPVEGILVGVPPNTSPTVQVLESRYETSDQKFLAPVPKKEFKEDGEVVTTYEADEAFYTSYNDFYPHAVVEVGEFTELRHQIVAKITVAPLQYNPATQSLKKLTHLRFRVEFRTQDNSKTAWTPMAEEDPHFEPVYKELLLNYDDAKQWRGTTQGIKPPSIVDSTGGWFVPGRQYYRIPVAQDGFYRLSAADLIQAGINPELVDFSTLAIYNKGKSIPVLIGNQENPDSVFIDYYAQRNYGVSSYFDLYSDTSSYFLTWNDTLARRYRIDTMISSSPQLQSTLYIEKVHLEQDLNYYFGCKSVKMTDEEPGEGWYWDWFYPNNVSSYSFNLDTVVHETGGEGTLKVRLNGTNCFLSQHRVRFTLNGNLIGDTTFVQDSEAVFFQSFSATMLRSGSNTLQVTSVPTVSPINSFYLDWFEVEFPRPFRAINNQLLFSFPANPGDTVEFTLRNFTADTVEIFDLTEGRKIVGITQNPGSSVVFRDTLSIDKQYLAIGRNIRQQPLPLTPKIFQNLRARTNGADYVIITHSKFRSASNRLAQHRRTVSRLRTAVVDVQDIYDEFNFGYKNSGALRDFLRHTYYNWRKPSPTYVLLMGDACWDYKAHFSNTIKKDYVPSFGNPPSDNALVSFHPVKNYLPYMLVGRLPVEDSVQAQRVVTKVIGYDTPPVDEWNKSFLFITGGTNFSERFQFNYYSDRYINNYVLPSPIGGTATRIYKTSDAIIDGEFTPLIQQIVSKGVVYLNFIGHSGGRVWNVNSGSPNDLQNTNGKLTFINSTTCWIGFFSDPRSNVLGEDFLLADNRGAIGVWATSATDDAVTGDVLSRKFLDLMQKNYARSFGQLTTIARLYYWTINSVTTPTVITVLHQHPLLGDPYSVMALPIKPDLAFKDSSLSLNTDRPTSDSTVTLKVKFWNYGLTPTDSVRLTITDSYTDLFGKFQGTRDIVPSTRGQVAPIVLPPTNSVDSVFISWDVRGQAGSHLLTAVLDPLNKIQELTKSNNTIQQTFYVYRNIVASIKPPAFTTTASGAVTLTATTPAGNDTTPLHYFFEIDTTSDFSSSGKITSPTVYPGSVSAEWTPTLVNNTNYFWRSRAIAGGKYGAWAVSSFETNDTDVVAGEIRWKQNSPKQFAQNRLENTVATDTGVTMIRTNGLTLYVRSLGYRENPDRDYYSVIRIGDQTIFGLYWIVGEDFIVARINEYSGAFEYRAFSISSNALADSMANYIQNAPNGRYIAITLIRNYSGYTNVNTNLRQTIQSLGSVNFSQVQPGHAWALISRKGYSNPVIESWSLSDSAVCTYQMPTYYNAGQGKVFSPFIGPAHQWDQLRWISDTSVANTNAVLKVLGIQPNHSVDTLFSLAAGQTGVNLSSVNASQYPQLQLLARLSNTSPEFTPKLLSWTVDYFPPEELATSAWVFHASPSPVSQGTPMNVEMDVYNLGYRRADSVRVTFSLAESGNQIHQVILDSIAVNSFRHVSTQVPTTNVPSDANTLQTLIAPRTGENDLYSGNNVLFFPFTVVAPAASKQLVKVYFDGKEITDGDYVSPTPLIMVEIPPETNSRGNQPLREKLLIDGSELQSHNGGSSISEGFTSSETSAKRTVEFRPQLADGQHQLQVFRTFSAIGSSSPPSELLLATVRFNVQSSTGLLNVFNYPNPFRQETYFTFIVTGNRPPDELRIKIYTVAGRLVRDLDVPTNTLQMGFNRVFWDGRDQDGDEVANGYYFYKVLVKTGDKSTELVQRLTKIK